jgi:SAM-dependent methyltransferase
MGKIGRNMQPDSAMTSSDDVKTFWHDRVLEKGAAPDVSTPALAMMKRENRFISDLLNRDLRRGGRVLDVGCANGYSSTIWNRSGIHTVVSVDACPEMVQVAREAYGLEAYVAEATALPFADGVFDCSIAKRVVCNLDSRDQQRRALSECLRVIRVGGLVVIVDFFVEGYEQLHRLRRMFGLGGSANRWHNLPLIHDDVRALGDSHRYPLGSMSYLLGFVIYPWVNKLLRLGEPSHGAWVHKIAAWLPSPFHFGPLEAYVIRKQA